MIWLFPMAGKGTRTSQLGEFKPFIRIQGRPMLEWLLASVSRKIGPTDRLVFTTTQYYEDQYGVAENLPGVLEGVGITSPHTLVLCEETPRGPADSIYRAKEFFDTDSEAVVNVNTDQVVDFDLPDEIPERSGFLPLYAEFTSKSSYCRVEDGLIVEIREKQSISHFATAGVYGVSRGAALVNALEQQFEGALTVNGEYYVAPALNFLIRDGFKLYPTPLRAKFDLGDLGGIQRFQDFLGVLAA